MNSFSRRQGFTLLECLITIAILAIFASLIIPSFAVLRGRAQQLHTIDQLETAVATARHIAVSRKVSVTLCGRSANHYLGLHWGATDLFCGKSYTYGVGLWIESPSGWRLHRVWEWEPILISNRSGSRSVGEHIVFSERGLAFRNMTWSTCANGSNLSLVLNRVGRPIRRAGWGRC